MIGWTWLHRSFLFNTMLVIKDSKLAKLIFHMYFAPFSAFKWSQCSFFLRSIDALLECHWKQSKRVRRKGGPDLNWKYKSSLPYISCLHSLLLLPLKLRQSEWNRMDCGTLQPKRSSTARRGLFQWGTAAASNQKHPQRFARLTAESLYLNATINMNNVQINGMIYDVTFCLRFMLYARAIRLFARSVHSQTHAWRALAADGCGKQNVDVYNSKDSGRDCKRRAASEKSEWKKCVSCRNVSESCVLIKMRIATNTQCYRQRVDARKAANHP